MAPRVKLQSNTETKGSTEPDTEQLESDAEREEREAEEAQAKADEEAAQAAEAREKADKAKAKADKKKAAAAPDGATEGEPLGKKHVGPALLKSLKYRLVCPYSKVVLEVGNVTRVEGVSNWLQSQIDAGLVELTPTK